MASRGLFATGEAVFSPQALGQVGHVKRKPMKPRTLQALL